MTTRSPIISVLGHVDHGKTTVLDHLRGSGIAAKEAGLITQHVGASFMPKEVIEQKAGTLLKKYGFTLEIPGLLFIDTPGHEAFITLRKRGGSIADLAILVIDINQGIQPQTIESIEILKSYKTPFIIAANKIDKIHGWQTQKNAAFTDTIKKQSAQVQQMLEEKVYEIVAKLGALGFNSERFDRVKSLTNEILIVPISAKTGEGFPELTMFITGLSQKFMLQKLNIHINKPAKGTVLEVKELQGLGKTIDAIIYEGTIKQGDKIAVMNDDYEVLITKVRALLEPAPLEEIRDTSKKFKSVPRVIAAAGLKISAPNLEKVLSGSPLQVVEDEEEAIHDLTREIEEIKIKTDREGAIIKADALGSLEALVTILRAKNLEIKRADIGPVTKQDVFEAEAIKKQNRYLGVIFAFNVKTPEDIKTEAKNKNIPLFESNVIYHLEESYEKWAEQERDTEKQEQLQHYIFPAELRVIPGFIFRATKPAVVGVEVKRGIIKSKYPLMNEEGKEVGVIQSIQEKSRSIDKAEAGQQVAISIQGATVGRNLFESDILYTAIPLNQIYELLGKINEKELLMTIRQIKEGNR